MMNKINKSKGFTDSLTDVSSNISTSYENMLINLKFNKRPDSDQKLIKKRKHSVDSHNCHTRTRSSSNRPRETHRSNKSVSKSKSGIKTKRETNSSLEKSERSQKSGSDRSRRQRPKSVWADESEVSRYTGPISYNSNKPDWPDNPAYIKYTKPNTPTRPSRRMPDRFMNSYFGRPQSKSDYSDESIIIREKPPIPPLGGHHSPKLSTSPSKSIPFPRKLIYESFWGRQLRNLDFRNAD